MRTIITTLALIFLAASPPHAVAEKVVIGSRQFEIPAGFQLELATTPELSVRPIVVDFDDQGHLYVAESSGTNDDVQTQLRERPHSILRLTDTDQDGTFDQRTVFADRMMFPEGVLCHAGSVFVAAPPQIWKLTDTNKDGVADEREVWFDGQTLTGCANDLHGPYLGPDGWIYWCKGAFAEQTHERSAGAPLVTRAAHIFRRKPSGGPIEPVMTGGMDNPVEVVFTSAGERIFTTTFFQHPADGQRDGLVHAIYGGVYGKRHGVLEGHPRTGDLMPVLTHLGAAAASGLVRLQSDALGFRDHLLSACFNLHSIKRHELTAAGATFQSRDTDLVVCDDLDFHPTDVIEDADGSVLIIDTGGWYKLCCPTSQLHKPDVPGAIYRLSKNTSPKDRSPKNNPSKNNSSKDGDPRGLQLDWDDLIGPQLGDLLSDERFAVRRRAAQQLSGYGIFGLIPIENALTPASPPHARLAAIWAACQMNASEARETVRRGLHDSDPLVRQAATHATSVWRDRQATPDLVRLLKDESLAVRRTAAEALGRIGAPAAVPHLLAALEQPLDRALEHSLIYALIETNSADKTRRGLDSDHVQVRRASVLALSAMPSGEFGQAEVSRLLASEEPTIRQVATEIAEQHPEWGSTFVSVFRRQLEVAEGNQAELVGQIAKLCKSREVLEFACELLAAKTVSPVTQIEMLRVLDADLHEQPVLRKTLTGLLTHEEQEIVAAAVENLARSSREPDDSTSSQLAVIAGSTNVDTETRLLAFGCLRKPHDELFAQAASFLSADQPARTRSLAATALTRHQRPHQQLVLLTDQLALVGPLELSRLLTLFDSSNDDVLGGQLFTALNESPVATALPGERVARLAAQYGPAVTKLARPLLKAVNVDPAQQSMHLAKLLQTLPSGDIRRGQLIFHNEKTACFACHQVGYRGGTVGPDLSRIARTRSRRDLLEAIIYPSQSFVRSYEPITVITVNGQQWSGTVRDQSADELVLQLSVTEQRTVRFDDIETTLPGKVSIMPTGLEQQLSQQDLADLLTYLESRK